jgi:hypothetical protein
MNSTAKNTESGKKKGWLASWIESLDKKLEEKSKSSCCCSSEKQKGSKCC